MRKRYFPILMLGLWAAGAGCGKALIKAKAVDLPGHHHYFAADANRTYYAVRWALDKADYPVASEDLAAGELSTSWIATKSDSHYIEVFDRKDFGVNGAYYKFKIKITPDTDRTRVDIMPQAKTLVAHLNSSGREERKIFKKIADYLNADDIEVTNLGATEISQEEKK